ALTEDSGTESYPFRAGTAASLTDIDATVKKYGYVYFLTEEADLKNFNGQTEKLIETLAIVMGRTFNQLQRNVLEDNGTFIYASGGSQDDQVANIIDGDLVRAAVNVLNRNSAKKLKPQSTGSQITGSVPIRSGYAMLFHSDVEEDIRRVDGFIEAERYASHTGIFDGEIGFLHGARCISSEDASIDTGSGGAPGNEVRSTGNAADLYTCVVIGMDAHGAVGLGVDMIKEVYEAGEKLPAMQLFSDGRDSGGTMDPLHENMTLSVKGWHAGNILNSTWHRNIRVAASVLDI
ncbi:hypothetical protein LCGC14_2880850, partial [marine sediment metagenome]